MKPPLHRPVADATELAQLEERLIRARRRFRGLLKTWLTLAVVMAVLFVIIYGMEGESGPPVPVIIVLATAILVAWRAARTLVTQPRMLAAQRELLGQRQPGSTAASVADLRGAVRSSTARLRRQIAALSPPRPELVAALDAASADAERRFREIAADSVRDARDVLAGTDAPGPRTAGEERRARIECYRLALASLECEVLLEPDSLAGEALPALQRARRFVAASR
jgi:hypothetical protein